MSKTTKLPMAPQEEPEEVKAMTTGPQREAAIREGVLNALGRPAQLFRVAVMPLWNGNYRVNVFTGEDASSVKIPNSYFVTADENGNILDSIPRIQKLY